MKVALDPLTQFTINAPAGVAGGDLRLDSLTEPVDFLRWRGERSIVVGCAISRCPTWFDHIA
jgi:hypothetical protein